MFSGGKDISSFRAKRRKKREKMPTQYLAFRSISQWLVESSQVRPGEAQIPRQTSLVIYLRNII